MAKEKELTCLQQDVTAIRISTAKTEQHLLDLNGKVAKHDNFLTNSCPERQREFQSKIDEVKQNITRITTLQNLAQTVLLGLLMYYLTRGI